MTEFDSATLALITQETRACFLSEDVPGYMRSLRQSLAQLQQGQLDFTAIMHALHSLKGGSGISQLFHLNRFTHKLEDLMELLRDRGISDYQNLSHILAQSIDEIDGVLATVQTLPADSLADVAIDGELEQSIKKLLLVEQSKELDHPNKTSLISDLVPKLFADANPKVRPVISSLVRATLTRDLEECLDRAEQGMQNHNSATHVYKQLLANLFEECMLLGDTLGVDWLVEAVAPLTQLLNEPAADWQNLGLVAIAAIRHERAEFLADNLETLASTPIALSQKLSANLGAKLSAKISHLRIPTTNMEGITSSVGELLVRHERLVLQQQQLHQTSQNLRTLMRGLIPMQDYVQNLYDQLAIAPTGISTSTNIFPNAGISTTLIDSEFDALELDQYTNMHSMLQDFQETFLGLREARSDIDISQRELAEEISELRLELDRLYQDVTKSRLVPFQNLAQRFTPQLGRLCREFGKSVQLQVVGEEVLIDQAILEQLQTPLNHLLVNAFDHGIEPSPDRLILGKPETATILLKATISANQVEIMLQDDGNGIDLVKVHHQAIAQQLCDPGIPFSQWRREEILDLIFQPGFSTCTEVSALSGRGMGLDIVRSQIKQLRGSFRLDTIPGTGTTFTIRLPLAMSLMPLLICTIATYTIAIPCLSILEIFRISEVEVINQDSQAQIKWRSQFIPLHSLSQLIAFADANGAIAKICLVLQGQDSAFAVTIDAILEEKSLILKPFDQVIPTPAFLAGCTVLGTGKVVPVILPQEINLENLSRNAVVKPAVSNNLPDRILIAEDSIATRNMLERTLKQMGYEVIACRDGQEAWETLQHSWQCHQSIHLVISDIEMPRLNGYGLLQAIRTHNNFHALPVVMLTSRTGDRHRQKAMSLGASAYLFKPFNHADILQCIQPLLELV